MINSNSQDQDVNMRLRPYREMVAEPFSSSLTEVLKGLIIYSMIGLVLTGCGLPAEMQPRAVDYIELVRIHRDEFGVPHVHGETDAAAAFGFAYAQAEDNFWQIEDNYIRALGRASELYGDETLLDDWLNRAIETEALSQTEYVASSESVRALLDGYAAGLNHFVQTHPEVSPRLINRFEPWYPLAFIRYLYYQRGFLNTAGLSSSQYRRAMQSSAADAFSILAVEAFSPSLTAMDLPASEQGSNSMAVAPSRSASGNALLFINPHLPFFGPGQVYEGHVISDEGWNFSGYTRFGFPMPYVGFNENLGWASTDNRADQADAFAEHFDDPENDLAYRFGSDYRVASEYDIQIVVESDTLRFTIRKTHHGPIVGESGDRPVAVRMARFSEPGWLDQWYAMTRATDFESFREAASRLDMLFGNYLYADRQGNIQYVYNGAVPRRREGLDWTGIVDGSDPRNEWDGYHSIEELPQVLNPQTGWIQNCNGTPFLATDNGNPDRNAFPEYMVSEGDNARSRAARRILESDASFTFGEWTRAAYDTHVILADEDLPGFLRDVADLRQRDPSRSRRLADAVSLLNDWDRKSSIESEAMTLFIAAEAFSSGRGISLNGLERALNELEAEYGTYRVPWGEINRLQRVQSNGIGFADDIPSIPVAGVPSWAGSMFTFWSQVPNGQTKRYGTGGNSYVAVIEFGDEVRALSLHTFGTSADPQSVHFFDQAPRYATGEFKDAWLTLNDVERNAVRSYRPADVSTH